MTAMPDQPTDSLQRRAALGQIAGVLLWPAWPQAAGAQPTPACGPDAEPTARQTEGPYFKANSPLRRSLRDGGDDAELLLLGGQVLGPDCRPVAGALLDFWHADAHGAYDNEGSRYRGHQFADNEGRYRLETIVPGVYHGRTRHLHVKVQAPGGRVLTTQLYFPGETGNGRDFLYRDALQMAMDRGAAGAQGRFDFKLARG